MTDTLVLPTEWDEPVDEFDAVIHAVKGCSTCPLFRGFGRKPTCGFPGRPSWACGQLESVNTVPGDCPLRELPLVIRLQSND